MLQGVHSSGSSVLERMESLLSTLTFEQKETVTDACRQQNPLWVPLPGPQTKAYESNADILYYGGSAGGGKSDLLLGLALNEHKHSIIYRRQTTQLIGIQIRLLDEILQSRRGWNGQTDILSMPGRKVEFGSCNNIGDEIKYQGRPHDLVCVGKGTPVWMGDGSRKSIENVIVGDHVHTLEGPHKVTATIPIKKKAVTVKAFQGGEFIGSQVQSRKHSLLMPEGWFSYDTFYGSHPSSTSLPSRFPVAYISAVSSLQTSGRQTSPPGVLLQDLARRKGFFQYLLGYLSRWGLSSDTAYKDQGTFRAMLSEKLSAFWRLALFPQWIAVPLEPCYGLSEPYWQDPSFVRGSADAQCQTSLQYYPAGCLSGSRQHDASSLQKGADAQVYLLQQGDAGRQTPSCFGDDGQAGTPKHTLHIESYIHPYTKEKCQTRADVALASLSFEPLPVTDLYDLTIEGVNHYITGAGFVNKNCFDEITHFLENQFRFLCGWLRTTIEGQRVRVVCAGNPPTTVDGRWVVKFWSPWLDNKHHNPALPGELRWYTTVDGRDVEQPDGRPVEIKGRMVTPLSRTFIPSSIADNPFLLRTGYEATLQSLPEPLRSQMLLGDFQAGIEDGVWQLIPTAWVDAAMNRWKENGKVGQQMDSAGVDVARGGKDKTVVAPRYGTWYDQIKAIPGSKTPDGATAAGFVVSCIRDKAVIHVDALGVGGETIGHLETNGLQVDAVVGYDTESVIAQHDKATGRLKFRNRRAMIHWRFRESLDPVTGDNISLPPDPELRADLCTPIWKLTPSGILVEEKDEIKKRIGRSPDKGDAVIYASICTPKKTAFRPGQKNITEAAEWSPFDA